VICQYCNAHNDEEAHRCSRCGRRTGDAGASRRPELFPVQAGAAAPAIEPHTPSSPGASAPSLAGPQLVTELAKSGERQEYAFQGSLFGPQEVSKRVQEPVKRAVPGGARSRRDPTAQHKLDFTLPIPEGARTLPTSVEAAVYCNAPVAIAAHRTIAAALDAAIILIAVGVFLGTFHFAGHEIVLTKQTTPIYGLLGVMIALFYRALFCIGNADTLGVQWAGLRTLNFDGRLPTRRERVWRTVGACVSVIATGIGFAWALCDEEHLTWHDYISKTFPSPREF
jgi:uncharacterized RDD family membrane protein YckC